MNNTDITIDDISASAGETFNLLNLLSNTIKGHIPDIIIAIIFLICGFFITKLIIYIFNKLICKTKLEKSVSSFLSQMLFAIIMILIAVISLSIAGVPMTTFTVLLGGFGVAIGLGFQNNISNLSSGIIIIMNGLYKIGDFVMIERGVSGSVSEISLITTTLVTTDGKSVYIPNSVMTSEYVMNYSKKGIRTLWLPFEITHDSDIDKALSLLIKILEESEYVIKDLPIKSQIISLNNGKVTLEASASCLSSNYLNFTYEINKNIKKCFDENNIKFFSIKIL